MNGRRPLLEGVAGLLERTYRLRSGLAEVGPFVIGDEGYSNLYRSRRRQVVAGSADEPKSWAVRTWTGFVRRLKNTI